MTRATGAVVAVWTVCGLLSTGTGALLATPGTWDRLYARYAVLTADDTRVIRSRPDPMRPDDYWTRGHGDVAPEGMSGS